MPRASAGQPLRRAQGLHGLTLRASADNVLGSRSMRDRTAYVDRRTGPIDYVEDGGRRIGPIVSFSVSGKF